MGNFGKSYITLGKGEVNTNTIVPLFIPKCLDCGLYDLIYAVLGYNLFKVYSE